MASHLPTDKQASFPLEFNFPQGQGNECQQAAAAVREEYRASVRWKRLRCREVMPINDDGEDAVAANGAHRLTVLLQLQEVDGTIVWSRRVGKKNATSDVGRARLDSHDRLADDRFTGAGFADERGDLSWQDAQACAPDRFDLSAHNGKRDLQIFNAKQICACSHAIGSLAVLLFAYAARMVVRKRPTSFCR